MNKFHVALAELGLNESDVDMLLLLMSNSSLTVPEMVERSGYSRTTVYDSLNNLHRHALIDSDKQKREVYYSAVHPDRIREMIEEQKNSTQERLYNLDNCFQEMFQMYESNIGKPGIQLLQTPRSLTVMLAQLAQSTTEPVSILLPSILIPELSQEVFDFFLSSDTKRQIIRDNADKRSQRIHALHEHTHNTVYTLPHSKKLAPAAEIIFPSGVVYIKQTVKKVIIGCSIIDNSIADVQRDLFTVFWETRK